MAIAGRTGEVSHTDVADMRLQVAARDERMAASDGPVAEVGRTAVVAVVSGAGIRGLYESLGVGVLDGAWTSTRPPTSCWPPSTPARRRRSSSSPTTPT